MGFFGRKAAKDDSIKQVPTALVWIHERVMNREPKCNLMRAVAQELPREQMIQARDRVLVYYMWCIRRAVASYCHTNARYDNIAQFNNGLIAHTLSVALAEHPIILKRYPLAFEAFDKAMEDETGLGGWPMTLGRSVMGYLLIDNPFAAVRDGDAALALLIAIPSQTLLEIHDQAKEVIGMTFG